MKIKFPNYFSTAKMFTLEAKCKKPKFKIQIEFSNIDFRFLFSRNKFAYIDIDFFKDHLYSDKTYAHNSYSEPHIQIPSYYNLVIFRELSPLP